MSKTLKIKLSDATYQVLKSKAEQEKKTVPNLAHDYLNILCGIKPVKYRSRQSVIPELMNEPWYATLLQLRHFKKQTTKSKKPYDATELNELENVLKKWHAKRNQKKWRDKQKSSLPSA